MESLLPAWQKKKEKKKKKKGAQSHQAAQPQFCPGQNFMNDLDKVIKGPFAGSGRNKSTVHWKKEWRSGLHNLEHRAESIYQNTVYRESV